MSTSTEPRTDHEKAPESRNVLFGIFPFVGLLLFLGATAIQFAMHGTDGWQSAMVTNAVTYLIGAQAIGAGIVHMFYGPPVARSIGWDPSPFQWEVGGANLGLGIAGVWAGSFHPDYSLAIIIVAMAFLWVAGVGHIREIVKERNFAINNAGPIMFFDFLVPLFCLVIWLLWATA